MTAPSALFLTDMKKRPSAQILCIGTELLLGNVLDTNSHTLSVGLADLGINLYYRKTVGDNFDRLVSSFTEALCESDVIILSGGMGSTADDLTVEAVSTAMHIPLELHEETLSHIKAYYEKKGTVMSENNKKQALVPKGALVFKNNHGMAPCIIIEKEGKTVIILPGPPRELEPLFRENVMPFLKEKFGCRPIVSKMVRMWGIAESAMDEKIRDLEEYENPTVAPYAKNGEAFIRISARGESEAECLALIEPVKEEIYSRLGDFIWTDRHETLEEALVEKLSKNAQTVAFAESCTGGLSAKRVTDVAGASKVLKASVVTYSAETKMKLVGVKKETLDTFGTISAECAEEMAEGIRLLADSDIGVSITGLAGPTGDEGKPVGLVFIGISTKEKTFSKRYFFPYSSDRAHVRLLASSAAIHEALKA